MMLPRHIAIIMDGNGRWAQQRHLPRVSGHKAGVHAVRRTVEASIEQQVEVLTLFAFSRENWQRPIQEVNFLMELLLKTVRTEIKKLDENNVRLKIIGDKQGLNLKLQNALIEAEQLTADNTALTLAIALNYGGLWDVTQASKRIAERVVAGELAVDAITEDLVIDNLATEDLPPPDLMIRTSGEQRLSNFLMLQAAYAELYFTDVLWPDFRAVDLQHAIAEFARRNRRYGALTGSEKAVNDA